MGRSAPCRAEVPQITREYTVRITVSGANIIDSLSLTNAYEVMDFTNLTSFGQVVVRQTNPASATYDFFAEFELTSLTVSPAPEPAFSMGLAAGLIATLALAPRRRRVCRS